MQGDVQERPTLSDSPLGNYGNPNIASNTGFWVKNEESKSTVSLNKSESEFRSADKSYATRSYARTTASDSDSDSLLYSHTRSDSYDPMELGTMASSNGDLRLSYDQANSRYSFYYFLFIFSIGRLNYFLIYKNYY